MQTWICLGVALLGVANVAVGDADELKLPLPQTTGGKPLMQTLQERHSAREFGSRALEPQILSNLLWAAGGVNRTDTGKRTAPSARDWREIDIYVAMPDAAYLYDPNAHALKRVVARDLRALTGVQDFVATAPLNLVYVADRQRMKGASGEDLERYTAADTGFVAQNVYLFCASVGLNTVVRGSVDRAALAAALKLAPHQQIVLAQTVGYPP